MLLLVVSAMEVESHGKSSDDEHCVYRSEIIPVTFTTVSHLSLLP